MKSILKRFAKNESGATAIEYALIAALMAVGLITAVPLLSGSIQTSFTNIGGQLEKVPGG